MKVRRKRGSLFIMILALVVLFNPTFKVQAAQNDNPIYYESVTTETVTSGVIYEHIVRFTKQGWQDINVLRVHATNPYINLEALVNPESLLIPKTTEEFAKEYGAVAAINASFFNTTHTPGETMPIGPLVVDGDVKTASVDFNKSKDYMATFSVNTEGEPFIDYWKTELTLINQAGKAVPVGRYNMPYYGYNDLTVLDRSWGEYSPGSATSDFVEMVVENNRVVDIRNYKPSVRIPENGFVVVTKKAGVHLFNSNFKIGETIRFEIKTVPDLSKIQTALSGGGVLVNKGAVPSTFTHDVTGVHPRTAIGITKDGTNVIMVTVDGRQQGKKGMTLTELANLMIELGAYNALNLDGGGSTAMVVRREGQTDISTVNSPSDGSQRKIPVALGITVDTPRYWLMEYLYINTDDTNIFVGSGRELRVTAMDQNHNPMDTGMLKPLWSVEGVEGVFKDNVFYPSTTGRGTITAKMNYITAKLDILVLDKPVKLIPPSDLVGIKGETMKLPYVKGMDQNGMTALLSPVDLTWTMTRSMGVVDGEQFTPMYNGTDLVTVAFGQAKAYVPLRVATIDTEPLDDFESLGKYGNNNMKLNFGQKKSGNAGGMISYSFYNSDQTTVTGTYKEEGLLLDKSASRISLQVHLFQKNYNSLTAQITDADGKLHNVVLTNSMDWIGWKQLDASVESISKPARLTGISVVKTKDGLQAGVVTMDDLTVSEIVYPKTQVQLPTVKEPSDAAYNPTDTLRPAGNLHFTVMGQTKPKDTVSSQVLSNLSGAMNNLYNFAAFTGTGSLEEKLSVYKPVIPGKGGYSSFTIGDNLMISLDTKNKNLTESPEQWKWFIEQLEKSEANNVFVFMNDSHEVFTDRAEAQLFTDTLEKVRKAKFSNIWVFSEGKTDSVTVKNGVRYNQFKPIPEDFYNAQYMLVTVDGTNINYQYKNVQP